MRIYFGTFGLEGEQRVFRYHLRFGPLPPRLDLWRHANSPRWGIDSQSSLQLSLALLADALDNDHLACRFYQSFGSVQVSRLTACQSWVITDGAIRQWALDAVSEGTVQDNEDGLFDLGGCDDV